MSLLLPDVHHPSKRYLSKSGLPDIRLVMLNRKSLRTDHYILDDLFLLICDLGILRSKFPLSLISAPEILLLPSAEAPVRSQYRYFHFQVLCVGLLWTSYCNLISMPASFLLIHQWSQKTYILSNILSEKQSKAFRSFLPKQSSLSPSYD